MLYIYFFKYRNFYEVVGKFYFYTDVQKLQTQNSNFLKSKYLKQNNINRYYHKSRDS